MDKKYQNGFFIFGIIVLALMLTGLDYTEVWNGLVLCCCGTLGGALCNQYRSLVHHNSARSITQYGGHIGRLSCCRCVASCKQTERFGAVLVAV